MAEFAVDGPVNMCMLAGKTARLMDFLNGHSRFFSGPAQRKYNADRPHLAGFVLGLVLVVVALALAFGTRAPLARFGAGSSLVVSAVVAPVVVAAAAIAAWVCLLLLVRRRLGTAVPSVAAFLVGDGLTLSSNRFNSAEKSTEWHQPA